MRCHDTKCEKKYVFSLVKKKQYFLRKTGFFITEEKTGFLKKNLQICGFLMR